MRFREAGFTIVEVMVALSLGVVLVVGIGSLLLGGKRAFRELESLSRLQQNARFAMHSIVEDIRMAGYTGCLADKSQINNHLNLSDTGEYFDFSRSIDGDDYAKYQYNTINKPDTPKSIRSLLYAQLYRNWRLPGAVDKGVKERLVQGTDTIYIRYFGGVITTYDKTGTGTEYEDGVPISNAKKRKYFYIPEADVAVGDIVAISDCVSADIFQIERIRKRARNQSDSRYDLIFFSGKSRNWPKHSAIRLSHDYKEDMRGGARLRRVSFIKYVVATDADGDRSPDIADGTLAPPGLVPSLYRIRHEKGDRLKASEIARGVENIQFLYGMPEYSGGKRTDGQFYPANKVPDFSDVDSVKVSMLMRSEEEVPGGVDTRLYPLFHNPDVPKPIPSADYGGKGRSADQATGFSLVDPEDLRVRRRIFSGFAKVRNAGQ